MSALIAAYAAQCRAHGTEPAEALCLALERDRVVGVLDKWAGSPKGAAHRTWDDGCGTWVCDLVPSNAMGPVKFRGPTPDAARAAAALAIEAGEV